MKKITINFKRSLKNSLKFKKKLLKTIRVEKLAGNLFILEKKVVRKSVESENKMEKIVKFVKVTGRTRKKEQKILNSIPYPNLFVNSIFSRFSRIFMNFHAL